MYIAPAFLDRVVPSLPELPQLASAVTTQHITHQLHFRTEPCYSHPHSYEYSRDAMAPRKKIEEKASANEAADMVLHYLRMPLTIQ
jgi:hypothetical protein